MFVQSKAKFYPPMSHNEYFFSVNNKLFPITFVAFFKRTLTKTWVSGRTMFENIPPYLPTYLPTYSFDRRLVNYDKEEYFNTSSY